MAHNGEVSDSRGRAWGWSWPRTLNKRPAYELTRSGFMVSPNCRLPDGWNISADGYPVPPLPRRKELTKLTKEHRRALPAEDRADPSYGPKSDWWRLMLADERMARVEAFDGPVRPLQYNKVGHHA
jgi:hypothetical protein